MHMSRLTAVSLVVVFAGVTVRTASAQGLEQSRIEGVVRDQSGAVLPDVSLVLQGTGLIGGARATKTDERGAYRFMLLLPGEYVLRAQAAGFVPTERAGLVLPLATTLTVDLALTVAGVAESVRVDARGPVVDVRSPAIVTNIDHHTLQLLPIRRVLSEVLTLAPGISNPTVVAGLAIAYGGTLGSNGLYIDGVDATEPRRQGSQLAINYNWLEQVQIVALGAGAHYGEFTGATALGVLRAGGNRFSGLGEYWTSRFSWIDRNGSSLAGRETLSLWDSTAQLGGPIVQDRLWFFTGLEFYRFAYRPLGYTGDQKGSEYTPRVLAKLTAAPGPDSRLEGHVQWNRTRTSAVDAGPLRMADALNERRQNDASWNLRFTKPFGQRLLLEARTGGYTSDSWEGPMAPRSIEGPGAFIESRTNIASRNSPSYRRIEPIQVNSIVSATRTFDGPSGGHELRFGLEYKWNKSVDASGFPGGERIITTNGQPTSAQLWAGNRTTAIGRRTAVYAQDRWSVHDRVTIDAGLRLDLNRGSTPQGGVVFSSNPASPRLGIAWAVDRQNKAAIKASAGRYHDTLFTERVGFMDIPGLNPTRFFTIDATGARTQLVSPPALSARAIDPHIRQSHTDQYVVGYERELFVDALFQAQYIRRNFNDFMAMTETRLEWAPVTLPDPGEDGRVDTPDDGPSFTAYRQTNPSDKFLLLTNPPDAYRRYDGLQTVFRKRWSERWQLQASYTWSRTVGTASNGDFFNAGLNEAGDLTGTPFAGKFLNPNGRINAEGRPTYDIREFKVLGGYEVPVLDGFVVSGILQRRSGNRWERKISYQYADPQRRPDYPPGTARIARDAAGLESGSARREDVPAIRTWPDGRTCV